jgi:hypothetical protein
MISRAQRILFAIMLLAVVVMAAILIRLRERTADRLQSNADNAAPLTEATEAPLENVTLMIPNDLDGSLVDVQRSLPMPKDESARARVLITHLLEAFRAQNSTHSIPSGAGIDEVFLMPLPSQPGSSDNPGQMAIVNFSTAFAQAHPSGIEPETLTLLSIIATLHANLPSIAQVRFLIDGRQSDTLAGHADLTRTYLASSTNLEAH